MVQNHLSAIAAPKSWTVERKEHTRWIVRPMPGAHPLNKCVSLSFVIRNMLKYAKTMKETKKILYEGQIKVDKKTRKDYKFGIGLMDVLEIEKLGEAYRMLYAHDGTLKLHKVNGKENNIKLLKVINKTVIKKGKIQITFHDGRNMLFDKTKLNVGDSVLYDLNKKEIMKDITLENDSLVFLSGGKHVGKLAIIKDIIKAKNLEKAKVLIDINGKQYTTLMDYAFAVGKLKPEITIEAKNE